MAADLESDATRQRPSGYWPLQAGGWIAFASAMGIGRIGEMPGTAILLIEGPFATLGFITTLALYQLYRRARVADGFTARTVAVVTISSWIAGMVWTALFYHYLHGIALPVTALLHPGVVLPVRRGPVLDNTVYNTLTLLAWSTLYLGLVHRDQLQAQRDRALHAVAEARDAQLRMLAYQLNPHFLFNTLTSVRAMIDEDRGQAKQMVTELARFLRYALLERPLHLAPLADELAAVRGYLAIEKVRFEERLDVSIGVSPEAARCRVPAFLLNPLVENAIRHGESEATDGSRSVLRVCIRATVDEHGTLELVVENSGTLAARDAGRDGVSGIGLRNVRNRLAHHYPGSHQFTLDESAGRVRATITIPASNGDDVPAAATLLPAYDHAP